MSQLADVTPNAFKGAMSRFASGVTVVTMCVSGVNHGLTVSAFTSVSAEPPLILVCLGKRQRSHALLDSSGGFAVNILSAAQQDLGARFAVAPPEDRFSGLDCFTAHTGAPILRGSLAWMDCRIRTTLDSGDHGIFIGEVLALGIAEEEQQPLVYYDRSWRKLHANIPLSEAV